MGPVNPRRRGPRHYQPGGTGGHGRHPRAALLLTVAAVYVLARMALGAAGAPLPSTLAGLLMAGAYAAGLPLAQQMTARRLLAAR